MGSRNSRSRETGFTLIELLVVIAIIAILAAILFPVFIEAKNASKASGCTANLRQIGIAFRAYLDDWFAKAPPVADGYIVWKSPGVGRSYSANAVGWTERLWAYHHKVPIYKCPARRVNYGYGYNGNLGQYGQATMSPKFPSKLMVVFDSPGSGSGFINPIGSNLFATGNGDQTNEGQAAPRYVDHGKTYNNYSWPAPKPEGLDQPTDDQLHSQLFLPGPHSGKVLSLMWDGHVERISTWVTGRYYLVPL